MSDTIPPEELNKRRRVFQLLEELQTHMGTVVNHIVELNDLGMDGDNVVSDLHERLARLVFRDGETLVKNAPLDRGRVPAMAAQLDMLLAEAPKLTGPDGKPDPTQRPALQCHVLLASQMQPLSGSLSIAYGTGVLRMLSPATIDGKRVLAESFFSIEDVVSIMVEREITGTKSSIVGLT